MTDNVKGDLVFEVKATVRLTQDQVRKVLAGRRRWEKDRKENDHFHSLLRIYDDSDDLFDAFFNAAFDALAEQYPLPERVKERLAD